MSNVTLMYREFLYWCSTRLLNKLQGKYKLVYIPKSGRVYPKLATTRNCLGLSNQVATYKGQRADKRKGRTTLVILAKITRNVYSAHYLYCE